MARNHESSGGGVGTAIASGLIYTMIWITAGIGVGRSLEGGDLEQRERAVQIKYEQVEDQLERAHVVGNLILRDKQDTFEFDSPTRGHCSGSYTESGEGGLVVTVNETLDCTVPVPATRD